MKGDNKHFSAHFSTQKYVVCTQKNCPDKMVLLSTKTTCYKFDFSKKKFGLSRSFPGVASSAPAGSHTFVEIDNEIIFTVILLPSAESIKKDCCQIQAKVCARSTG